MQTFEERRQAAREKKEREEAEVRALFPAKVEQIAAALGMTARFRFKNGGEVHYCAAWLEDGTRTIHLTTQEYSPDFRLNVSGDYDMGPRELSIGWPYGVSRPSITVGLRRDAAVIAKDIQNRFIPDYDAAAAKVAEQVKSAVDYRDSRRSNIKRLAEVAGVELRENLPAGHEQVEFYKYYGEQPYTHPKLEVNVSRDSAKIEFDGSIERVAQVIAAIEQIMAQK
jgi:hypothetical protein